MRIPNITTAQNVISQIQQLGQQQAKLQAQVSSGQRISQFADDPAAAGRVLNYNSEQRALAQYTTNSNVALQVSQATMGSLQSLKTISDRATELGTLGAGTQSAQQTQAYATETNQLLEQAVQQANSKLGNNSLFAGTAVDVAPYTVTRDAQGQITGVAYVGNTAQSSIALSSTASVAPGADSTTTAGMADFLNHLVALRDSLQTANSAGVTTAQTGLMTTEDTFVSALAEQGAVQMRIQVNQSQQANLTQSLQGLVSGEVDADMPSTIVKLNQAQTAYQASLQSSASIMKLSLLDYVTT
jgi:flagellar hook-associated protein 3 FlgL